MKQLELPLEDLDEFEIPIDANYEGKWAWVLDPLMQRIQHKDTHILSMLTDEEVNLLYGKWVHIHREDFSNKVKCQLLTTNTTR